MHNSDFREALEIYASAEPLLKLRKIRINVGQNIHFWVQYGRNNWEYKDLKVNPVDTKSISG